MRDLPAVLAVFSCDCSYAHEWLESEEMLSESTI